ncbi:MAG: hypothetical protein KDD40_02130 [Bdellovibrionales bacterium]|nr:hypothetical protein [Bdellovibrionales bacterium]
MNKFLLLVTLLITTSAWADLEMPYDSDKIRDFLKFQNLDELIGKDINGSLGATSYYRNPPIAASLQDLYNAFISNSDNSNYGGSSNYIYNMNYFSKMTEEEFDLHRNYMYGGYFSQSNQIIQTFQQFSYNTLAKNTVSILPTIEFENLEVEADDSDLQDTCLGCTAVGSIINEMKSLFGLNNTKKVTSYSIKDFCEESGFDYANNFRWNEIANPKALKKFQGYDNKTGKPQFQYYISEEFAYYYLLKLQKPESIDKYIEDEEFMLLKAIFAYKPFYEKYYDLYIGALQNLATKNKDYYMLLAFTNNYFLTTKKPFKHVCRTKTDIYNIEKGIEEYIASSLKPNIITEFSYLDLFRPLLSVIDVSPNSPRKELMKLHKDGLMQLVDLMMKVWSTTETPEILYYQIFQTINFGSTHMKL